MKKLLAGASLFLLFLLFGGAWVSVVQFIPAGMPRTVAAILFGIAFAGFFFWILVERLQVILRGVHRLWTHLLQVSFIVALTILAFTFVYSKLGIKSSETGEVTRDVVACAYFSVVTFTTLGYGDYYPYGLGRAMAVIEAFTGYLILGLLVSTSIAILDPRRDLSPPDGDDGEE